MNSHLPGGVPDLGALTQPKQLGLLPALIVGRVEGGAPDGFWDGVSLAAVIREAIREDLREIVTDVVRRELRTLLTEEELTEVEQTIDRSYLEAVAKAGLESAEPGA